MHLKDIIEFFHLPRLQINLMHEKTQENHPFYDRIVKGFYKEAISLHPKLLFARKYQYGFALHKLPKTFDAYFMKLDSSARGNYRKALRGGYTFQRIDYNAHLEQVREIWLSTPVRQGILPKRMLEGRVKPITDPPTRTNYQDYPYFGVFLKERLVAYTACLISGELCSLNDIFGHAKHLEDGIVPLAIMEIVRQVLASYPHVKYYGYGTYFGASESLRRFKRKFLFYPHRVSWLLSTPQTALVEATVPSTPKEEIYPC